MNIFRFLLYVSVMLIITYLQQEFVLLPELQNLDIVGEASRAQILDRWQKMRWLAFVLAPVLLLLRLSLVTLCLFLGGFFFSTMSGWKYRDWWEIALKAQAVMLFYSVVLCIISLTMGSNQALAVTKYSSLLFLGSDNMESWISIPLAAINGFEVAYWLVMAGLIRVKTNNTYKTSLRFVLSSYGVGYLFYLVFLMFLVLYIS